VRRIRVPHEPTIATVVPRMGTVDFQRFGKREQGKWLTSGEPFYRAGDKRLTGAGADKVSAKDGCL
jgi:hypothetical protein